LSRFIFKDEGVLGEPVICARSYNGMPESVEENRLHQETATLIVAGLGIGGTLGGIVVGHFLTRSWQQQQWLLDNRREEYRELLNAITTSYMAFVHIAEQTGLGTTVSPEITLRAEQSAIDSFRTLRDRILIADEVKFANRLGVCPNIRE
jgi:hypothetical protein